MDREAGIAVEKIGCELFMSYRGFALAALLLGGSVVAAQGQSGITGHVTDLSGAAIAKARVLIHWDPAGSKVGLTDNIGIQQDVIVTTDADGSYSVEVPPGFYDVFVTSMAFTPTAGKVRVKKEQRATYNSKLKVDALVSRELD